MNKFAKIQSGATCVLVIATIILAICNIRLVKFTAKYADISEKIADYTKQYVEQSKKYVTVTRRMVDEMKKDRKERMRPYVSVHPVKISKSYFLKLTNLGDKPAFNIKISLKAHGRFMKPKILMNRLWQKEETFTFIGHEVHFLPAERRIFQLVINYKDISGNSYDDIVDVDLNVLKLTKDEALLDAVQKISESLGDISENLPKTKE